MTLWQNYSPNASRSLHPVFLIRETETNQDLLETINPTTDKAREELNAEVMCCLFGKNYINVKIYIQDTMKDLMFKRLISGHEVQIVYFAKQKLLNGQILGELVKDFQLIDHQKKLGRCTKS